jgi:ferric-dicitrate binding protein FerR (iron transport regulator)
MSSTKRPTRGAALVTTVAPVSVTLADGSRVQLAPQSQLELKGSDEQRVELELERGRLQCAVAAKPERRFSVAAGGFEVVARGTRFSVAFARDDELAVEAQDGNVEIYRLGISEPRARLSAGQRWSIELEQAPPRTAASSSASDPARALR